MSKSCQSKLTGELAAKYYKYYLLYSNLRLIHILPLTRIQSKQIYDQYKKYFDKLAEVCEKYNISLNSYMKFFVIEYDKRTKTIEVDLCNGETLKYYVEKIKINADYQKIYDNFNKSVKNIVEDCNRLLICSAKDYLRYLIETKKISNYLVSGKISIYWYAAIPHFDKLIEKLDDFTKKDLKNLYNRFDYYNSNVNSAFMKIKNIKINPLKYTDEKIYSGL